jgi:DNA-binding LytR/AlgR family response regulator
LLNIALCDDMPVLRGILEMLIHEYETENKIKFNIYQFDSGEELLETFEEDKSFFDIFFLDYYMKKLTGLETALHIRRFDKNSSIVFVTSAFKRNELFVVNPLRILGKSPKKEEVFEILDGVLSVHSKSV